MSDLGPGMSYVFTEEWYASVKANADKRKRLYDEADRAATQQGHSLWWIGSGLNIMQGRCRNCSAWVQIDTEPPPNGIEIGGPAVAVDCGDQA